MRSISCETIEEKCRGYMFIQGGAKVTWLSSDFSTMLSGVLGPM